MTDVVEYGTRRTLVVAAVMLAALLQLADTTIVNVSLPTIDGSLGASVDEGTWFVTSYIVANVVVIPLSPFFSTVIGRGRYFALSILGFTLMSLVCGLATDTNQEIAFRFLQGAFGGGLMVPAQQIMRDTFPAKDLGKSQSLFGLAVVIGPTIGPTLGGILTDALSWNWVFFINVVPGLAAAILAFLFIRDPEPPRRTTVDGVGVALLALGLGALQFVLEEGERNDWFADETIRFGSAIAFVGLALFVWWELRTEKPAVALRVLGTRAVAVTVAISFVGGFALYGLFILQPQYTQASLGFTSTESGIFMMLRAGTTLALYPVTTWIVNTKFDQRLVVGAGLGTYALSCLWIANLTTTTADFDAFVPAQMLGGAGLAFFFVPLNVVLLRSITPAMTAPSLALQRLLQQLGGSVASASLVTYVDRTFVAHDAALRGGMTGAAAGARAWFAHGGSVPGLARIVASQDTALALADAVRAVGIVGIVAVPLVLVLRRCAKPPAVASRPSFGSASSQGASGVSLATALRTVPADEEPVLAGARANR